MAEIWSAKELISKSKLNSFTVRRMNDAEKVTILDSERLEGSVFHNEDTHKLEVYQNGSGAVFNITSLSNFLFGSDVSIGGINPQYLKIFDKSLINEKGKFSNFVIFKFRTSNAGFVNAAVKATIKNGSTVISSEHAIIKAGVDVFEIVLSNTIAINSLVDFTIEFKNTKIIGFNITGV